MPPVVPSPDQLPFFEELAPAPTPRRPHLRIQPPLLADLTARQRKAVTHGNGPLLIVAGAGTAKTTVITRRIAWLIAEKRAKPSEILALTFSDRSTVMSRAEQVIFLREHLFDLPLDRYRPLGDPTRFLHALVTLISRARDEDVPPSEYRKLAERLVVN